MRNPILKSRGGISWLGGVSQWRLAAMKAKTLRRETETVRTESCITVVEIYSM